MSRQGIVSIRIWMTYCEGKSGRNVWKFVQWRVFVQWNWTLNPHWTFIPYKRNHNELSCWLMISMTKGHNRIWCVSHTKSRLYVWFLQINVFPLTGIMKASLWKVGYFFSARIKQIALIFKNQSVVFDLTKEKYYLCISNHQI